MRSARTDKIYQQPPDWDDFNQGNSLQKACENVCNEMASRIFGYHLIKLGSLSSSINLSDCPIRNHVSISHHGLRCPKDKGYQVKGLTSELPLQESSIDAFFLTLELDFASDPHKILREIDHSITSDGHVLLCCLNPFSLSGITRLLPIVRHHPLTHARFFSPMRTKDWLQLLHYEIIEERYFYHQSLFSKWRLPLGNKTTELAKSYLAPYLGWTGSAYCILAKKQTIPMTKVKTKWKKKAPRFVPVGATRTSVGSSSSMPSSTLPSSRASHPREVQE